MQTGRNVLAATLAIACACPAWAGRPLATDNAETAAPGECELEVWHEWIDDDRAWIVSPVCGVNDEIEAGADLVRARVAGDDISGAELFVKVVPKSWQWDAPFGDVDLGVKFDGDGSRASGSDWRVDGYGASLLATWELGDELTIDANLGPQHDRESDSNSTQLNLALSWEPTASWLLFGELLANDRRHLNGGTLRTFGLRWWLLPDVLGLDLTASRENGGGSSTLWTAGFGWYGIGF